MRDLIDFLRDPEFRVAAILLMVGMFFALIGAACSLAAVVLLAVGA